MSIPSASPIFDRQLLVLGPFLRALAGFGLLLTVVLTLGGVQLLGLGIIGEYLGRVYMESKRRPSYLVRKVFRPPS